MAGKDIEGSEVLLRVRFGRTERSHRRPHLTGIDLTCEGIEIELELELEIEIEIELEIEIEIEIEISSGSICHAGLRQYSFYVMITILQSLTAAVAVKIAKCGHHLIHRLSRNPLPTPRDR